MKVSDDYSDGCEGYYCPLLKDDDYLPAVTGFGQLQEHQTISPMNHSFC